MIVRIEIDTAHAQAFFDYAGNKVRDAKEPLRNIRDWVIIPAIDDQLETEGGHGLSPWEPLSSEYERRKIADGYGDKPILERDGSMRKALLSKRAFRISRQELDFDPQYANPNVDYAGWHQGGGYVPGRPPQRTIIDLTVEDEEEIEMIFYDWLDELRTASDRSPTSEAFGIADMIDILGL